MSTRRAVIRTLFLLPLGLGACVFGGWGRRFRETQLGCQVEIRSPERDGRLEGELLMVRADGIVTLLGDRVVFARWDSMSRVTFKGVPVDGLEGGLSPTPPQANRMRQVSRYPFGLTERQTATLLERHGQTEMDTFR